MSLKQRINDEMKAAMKAKEKRLVGALRLITAAIKQIEVDQRLETLDDQQVTDVLVKMVKQRRDSIEQYQKANRDDLVEQEEYELGQIEQFLPEALSDDEINTLIQEAMTATGASAMKDMGKVMGMLKPKLAGRADMGKVSQLIKSQLSG